MVSFTHQGRRYSVEPYSVGYEEADQHGRPLLLRAWHEVEWRDFEVKFMSQIEIDSQHFTADRPGHDEMTIVLCNISGKRRPG